MPLILTILKSRTIQGAVVALAGWFMQKYGVEPGAVAEKIAEVATGAGALWGVYGMRDAIKPMVSSVSHVDVTALLAPRKPRKPRGPNKPKAQAAVATPIPANQEKPSAREIDAKLTGGVKGAKPVQSAVA